MTGKAPTHFSSNGGLRKIRHRGVIDAKRCHWARTDIRRIETVLESGQSVGAALGDLMRREACAGGIAQLKGGRLDPCNWFIPTDHPDGDLPVYFSDAKQAGCAVSIEMASTTLGRDNGEPSTHTHGLWLTQDGRRLGGHLCPDNNLIREAISVTAWLATDAGFTRQHDPETCFDLFAVTGGSNGDGVVATIRPNTDLVDAIRQVASASGIRQAEIRGTGSLFDLTMQDGRMFQSNAFEVGIVAGAVVPIGSGIEVSDLTLAGVGFDGKPVEGVIARGRNKVCVTFEVILAPGP
jgi:predicted DNA-binding protein with PD1-like motif